MIVFLNGAFGIGKTTVARILVRRVPNSVLYDPELIGIALQRLARITWREARDFQDLAIWRKLTISAIRVARRHSQNVIVPMAISNHAYLEELRSGIMKFERHVVHYCLVAPVDVVHMRLNGRGAHRIRDEWQFRRASECCEAHTTDRFAEKIDTSSMSPDQVAERVVAGIAGLAHLHSR